MNSSNGNPFTEGKNSGDRSKHEYLSNLDEAQLRSIVLVPLLRHLEMQGVIEYHGGSAEKGKDILCYYAGPLGERRYVGIVVKTTNLHGAVSARGSGSEVLYQVEQALNEPYTDVYDLKEVSIDECWVITSGEIKNTAVESVRGKLAKSNLHKTTRFVDRNRLIELIDAHMPGFWEIDLLWLHMAHSMKSAIVGTMSHAGFLRERWTVLSAEKRDARLRDIEADMIVLMRLLDTVRFYASKETPLRREAVRVADLVKHVSRGFRRSERIQIDMSAVGSSVTVEVDRDLIEHALYCVVENALKFSGEEMPVIVKGERTATHVVLSVTENGIGVPPDMAETIFLGGIRAENARRHAVLGFGSGLVTARKLLRMHNGDLKMISPRQPTVFAIEIPL